MILRLNQPLECFTHSAAQSGNSSEHETSAHFSDFPLNVSLVSVVSGDPPTGEISRRDYTTWEKIEGLFVKLFILGLVDAR